jgi:hypothetical protein
MSPVNLTQQCPDLFDRSSYPAAPGFKGAVETGKDAAAAIAPSASRLRDLCVAEFSNFRSGLTADEVADMLRMSVLAIRPRVSELRREGRIKDAGVRRPNASGRSAAVWVLSEGGVA